MKKQISIILSLVLALCLFCSCSVKEQNENESEKSLADTTQNEGAEASEFNREDMFSERDLQADYSTEGAVTVTLKGNTALSSSDAVKVVGSMVTLTEEATYILSGELFGMIVVDAPESAKPRIVFDGVSVESATSAALYIKEADKVFVTLAEGSENFLSNGGSFVSVDDSNIDSALFSKQDITINGKGELSVSSPAGHGIVAKDDLVLAGGKYSVSAASHGFQANDSIRIASGEFFVEAGKDAFHSENSDDTTLGYVYISGGDFDLVCDGDGISAGAQMEIWDGSYSIVTGGGSTNAENKTDEGFGGIGGMSRPGMRSYTSETDESDTVSRKALKSAGKMVISGGSFIIDSADDSVHSNSSVTVSGAAFSISSGDDAFHADDTLRVAGGEINVSESYEGLEALHIIVSGGKISLKASDDGLNAAGGNDESGYGGHFGGDMFGGRGRGGGIGAMSSSSDGSIVISGGELYINASGDGIDANGTLEISGGYTTVCGPTQGDTATLDYDVSATISGGTFVGTGGAGMAQSFSNSPQGVIAVSVGNQPAGTKIRLEDSEKNVLFDCSPSLSFAVVILSSPDVISGESYTLTVGSACEEFTAS